MKIICVGRNYADHIEELKNERPQEPVLFMKPDTAVLQKQFPFVIPEFTNDVHHEIELVVKINKVGKYIDAKFAHKYYDEVTVGLDFTARDAQERLKSKGLPWEIAKAFDGSAVIGDFVPKTNFESLDNVNFELTNNGNVAQDGSTKHMLWKVDELIAEISKYFTLKMGDVIFTGTPKGVAKVSPGDVLEGFLEGQKLFKVQIK
jgi:2-keto-4-pentenoate hydratase/2-oxohepta-3-ene-1,7-dioic acid hydratase in catechol pathway